MPDICIDVKQIDWQKKITLVKKNVKHNLFRMCVDKTAVRHTQSILKKVFPFVTFISSAIKVSIGQLID